MRNVLLLNILNFSTNLKFFLFWFRINENYYSKYLTVFKTKFFLSSKFKSKNISNTEPKILKQAKKIRIGGSVLYNNISNGYCPLTKFSLTKMQNLIRSKILFIRHTFVMHCTGTEIRLRFICL